MIRRFRKCVAKNAPIMRRLAWLRGWRTLEYPDQVGAESSYYAVYVPSWIKGRRANPLVTALHGCAGTVYEFVFTSLSRFAEREGFIVLCPPAKAGTFHTEEGQQGVLAALQDLRKREHIDDRQIYLLGTSMGGKGAVYIGFRNVDLFAAIAPVYGPFTQEEMVSVFHGKPMPAFVAHGAEDAVVPVEHSLQLVSRLKELGAECEFQLVPGLGHDLRVLDRVLPDLLRFFTQHAKSIPQRHATSGFTL